MIRLATFDMAGTTVDEGHHVYRVLEAVVREGATLDPAAISRWMGVEKREAIRNLLRLGGIEATDERVDGAFAWFLDTLATTYREPAEAPAGRDTDTRRAASARHQGGADHRLHPQHRRPAARRPRLDGRRRRPQGRPSTPSCAPTRSAAGGPRRT